MSKNKKSNGLNAIHSAKSLYLFFVDHDKLYAPGALTDPGEYENLPFHGLQSAPNKVRTRI